MGSYNSSHTDEEILAQIKQNDPLFQYQKYVDNENGMTIQDVMNIRACFLQLNESADPPEMVKVRKLRSFPFLTNDEILQFGSGIDSGSAD